MIPSIEKKSISDIFKEFEVEKTAMLAVRTIQEIADLMILVKDPHGPLMTTLANIEKLLPICYRSQAESVKDRGRWDLWWLPGNWLTGFYQTWKR